MAILDNFAQKTGKAVRGIYSKAAPIAENIAKKAIENPMGGLNPAWQAKTGAKFYSGLLGAQAAEPEVSTSPTETTINPSEIAPQQDGNWLSGLLGGIGNVAGSISGALSGVGEFAQKNPELFTGLVTAGIGASTGMNPLEYGAMGGQAYTREKTETQRQYEENMRLLASMGKNSATAQKDLVETIKNELDLYGAKLTPQQRQQYIDLRLSGKRPTYNAGVLGLGAGFQ